MNPRVSPAVVAVLRRVFVPAKARVVGGCLRDIARDPTRQVHDVDVIVHESVAPRVLAACRRLPVSYTHLTLPTIYSV